MSLFADVRGTGQDIVFLHGWGFNSAVWDRVAMDLSEKYRVTLIDLPGFGRSVNVKCNYEMDSLCDLLIQAIPKNSILLGWSMGGLIAQAITLAYPQHLKKLILLASNAQFTASENWPYAMKAEVLENFIVELVGNFNRTLQVFLMLQAQGGENAKGTIRQMKTKLFAHGQPDEVALRGGLLLLKNTSFVADLKKIQLPVYLMFGRLDSLVPLGAAKLMLAKLPQATLHIFEKSSHAPFISHHEDFMNILEEFILD